MIEEYKDLTGQHPKVLFLGRDLRPECPENVLRPPKDVGKGSPDRFLGIDIFWVDGTCVSVSNRIHQLYEYTKPQQAVK